MRRQNVSDNNMAKVQKRVQEETGDVIQSVQNSANTSNSSALIWSLLYYSDRQHNQCVYVSGLWVLLLFNFAVCCCNTGTEYDSFSEFCPFLMILKDN